jgi:hypothetical protein
MGQAIVRMLPKFSEGLSLHVREDKRHSATRGMKKPPVQWAISVTPSSRITGTELAYDSKNCQLRTECGSYSDAMISIQRDRPFACRSIQQQRLLPGECRDGRFRH